MKNEVWTMILFLSGISSRVTCDKHSELHNSLFDNYNPSLRPHCGNGTTNVTMDVALRQLLSLNEPTQEVKINVWIRLFWNDCKLTWNETKLGIESLTLPMESVWTPDITVLDCTDEEEVLRGIRDYGVKIFSNGAIQYRWPTVITIYCSLHVRNFPLDSQTCEFIFSSWIHDGHEINWFPFEENGNVDLENFEGNNGWAITSFQSTKRWTKYRCCKYAFPEIHYTLKIERRHTNHVVTLVLPCVVISFLPVLGFLLPVDYGEKMSLQVTILLALTVFLMVLNEGLPSSSESLPALGMYYASILFLVGASCVMTVIVIRIHHKYNGHVHPWAKKYIIGTLGRILFVKTGRQKKVAEMRPLTPTKTKTCLQDIMVKNADGSNNAEMDDIFTSIQTVTEQLHTFELRLHREEVEKERRKQWYLLAVVIDRIFGLLILFLMFLLLIIYFPRSE